MTTEQLLIAGITSLSGVVIMLWRLNLEKDKEIKALMREMIGLAKDVRAHLQNGAAKSSTTSDPQE